ncbi:MAG: hypothetical protein ACEQSB_00115 [Undibacterium sp.]
MTITKAIAELEAAVADKRREAAAINQTGRCDTNDRKPGKLRIGDPVLISASKLSTFGSSGWVIPGTNANAYKGRVTVSLENGLEQVYDPEELIRRQGIRNKFEIPISLIDEPPQFVTNGDHPVSSEYVIKSKINIGVYLGGILSISDTSDRCVAISVKDVRLPQSRSSHGYVNSETLRKLAKIFNDMADVLDENNEKKMT